MAMNPNGDSVDLSELSGAHIADDGVRRDRWGRYLVVPPGGGLPVPYRRATTVTKALDSEGSLVPWAQSRVLRGVVAAPDCLRRLRRLLKASDDPWYDTPALKAEFKALIAETAAEGGADEKRNRGTWLHGCAERSVLGLDQLPAFNAEDKAWLEQFWDCVESNGLVINPDPMYVETIVVHDRLRIAGKADYLQVSVPGYDLPLVGDLKTGDSLDWALRGFVMQLAIYASADAIYVQGADPNGSEDERLAMPPRDLTTACLIHAPQDRSIPFTVWLLDVQAGLAAFELALEVERWRDLDNVAHPYEPPMLRELAESIIAVQTAKTRAWLQERIDNIGRFSKEAKRYLVGIWPADLPTLRQQPEHSFEHLVVIESLLDATEAQFSMPFGPTRPVPEPFDSVESLLAAFPGSELLSDQPNPRIRTSRGEK